MDFGNRQVPGELRGAKWRDLDGDGVRGIGEPGLPGWTIFLDADGDGVLGAGEDSVLTDAAGDYVFSVPAGAYTVAEQLQAYFDGTCFSFDLPLDLERLTPFQLSVLQTARSIQPGTKWTYGQMAQAIGKPKASRAVGQALGRNPVPIVIPCHRVVASDGSLGGYSGGGGVESKRLLLVLEGAL